MDKSKKYFIFIITFSLLFAGCSVSEPVVLESIQGQTMGTYYVVKFPKNELEGTSKEKLKIAIDSELRKINYVMSTYIFDSELSLLNAKKADKAIKVSDDLFRVVSRAQKISFESGGAFDVTVGPLVNAWGFGPDKKRKIPTEDQLKELKSYVGYEKLTLDSTQKTIIKKRSKTYIDLSSIAKGFGVDRLGEFLIKNYSLKNLLIEIGGELRTWGKKGDKDWKIGIESPQSSPEQKVQKVVTVSGMAVATSGNYRNFYKYGEQVFAHTIDPKTGKPVNHRLLSATVFAKDCMTADAYATALMVLGPENGIEFSEKMGIMSYLIYEKDKKLLYKMSPNLKRTLGVK